MGQGGSVRCVRVPHEHVIRTGEVRSDQIHVRLVGSLWLIEGCQFFFSS